MILSAKRVLALGAVVIGVTLPATVFATNGMFLIGSSAKSVSVGGAAIAFPQDAMASIANPAAIGEIGNRADLDATIFIPKAKASMGPITESSGSDLFLMPAMGVVVAASSRATIGISAAGAGGGGSNYKQNLYDLNQNATNTPTGAPKTGNVGVSLMIMQMNPTMAFRINDTHSWGASLIIGVQRFKAFGLGNFTTFTTTQTSDHLTDNGSEFRYGIGARVGWLGKYPEKGLTFGLAATTKVYMQKFKKYKELFAEWGDIDTPANVGFGVALKTNPKLTFVFDITRTMYEDVRSIANLGPNTIGNVYPVSQAENSLGQDGGLGFGWRNQTVYKLGANYEYSKKWAYRVGYNYGKSPIPEEREIAFNIVAPATTQHHATFGATYYMDKNTELNFSYMHAFRFRQGGPTYIGGTGTIEMYQDSFGAAIGLKF